MIKFCGEISESSKQYLIKKESKSCFVVIVGSLLLCIPFILLSILKDWIFIIAIIPFIFLSIVSIKPPQSKTLDLIFPTSIVIKDDIIISQGKEFSISNQISYVKKVIDNGDWYHIIFKFPHKSFRYFCQKDLLIDGTLEDFERIFKDKIIKL